MKLSEKLRSLHSNMYLNLNKSARQDLLRAADLLDATTPRPWPPPDGVRKCLAWRKGSGWIVVWLSNLHGWRSGTKFLNQNLPQFWLPIPPDPEESK